MHIAHDVKKQRGEESMSHLSNVWIFRLLNGLKHFVDRISFSFAFVFYGEWCIKHEFLIGFAVSRAEAKLI